MDGAVLLIHHERALPAAARQGLMQAGCHVAVQPVVIVLPWLGRRPARETILRLRGTEATRRSRLIVWAEHGEMPNAVAALDFGADDCLALPFEPCELIT